MREIKFRMWNSAGSSSKMFYDANTVMECLKQQIICNVSIGYDHIADGSDFMQFTGLKDKNGKDIYEGDILDCQDRIVKVVWHQPTGQWDSEFIKYIFTLCSNGIDCVNYKYRAVVIGNIYENPELLK